MSVPLSITGLGKDRTLITFLGISLIMECSLEHLQHLVEAAILEKAISEGKIDPDEGFAKPMSPWGKEE